jgi:predicted phage terminase large subunit-like protein
MARAKALYQRAGGKLGAVNRQDYWETDGGGYVRCAGLNGPIVGDGFHVVFVDDPHRGRAEAESKTIREAVVTRFSDDVYTRREPALGDFKGTSFIVVHTRWHTDDLIGTLTRRGELEVPFEYINLPYEDSSGRVLAPELWPVETMVNYRRNPRNWSSVFLGRPTPSGGAVFEGSHLYEPSELPTGARYAIGIDLAYSAKQSADYSCAVVLARSGDGRVFVVDVVREQCRPRDFANHLLRLQNEYPGAPLRWYASGTESGVADLLRDLGVTRLLTLTAKHEKKVRALPASDAWNEGRVLLPRGGPGRPAPTWVEGFADEVLSFTGQGDAHDDQVDALAAGFDALDSGVELVAPRRETNRVTPWGGSISNHGQRRARPW